MKEKLDLDTPDGVTTQIVYTCDVCGEHPEQVYSYYWSQSGDILQCDPTISTSHVCAECLLKFVQPF